MEANGTAIIGRPLDRVDGILKVTGDARYAAELGPREPLHAVVVQSTIARGRIVRLDITQAERAPGVALVLTHRNAPRLPEGGLAAVNPPAGRVLSLLQDDAIHYNGEPIAVVVADTFERATDAARLVRVTYTTDRPRLRFDEAKRAPRAPKKDGHAPSDVGWGAFDAGLRDSDVQLDAVYRTPMEHHNPMEPHATLAQWDGGRLTLYDATQYVSGVRETVAKTLGIAMDDVRVIDPFVGGGFGCKGSTWSHVVLAAMAARQAGRPVKLVLARPQMFGPVGGRPQTEQHVVLGARRDGRLTALRHDVICHASAMEDFVEPAASPSRALYACPNGTTSHRLATLDVGVATFQRAPGEATGSFALESAMDELAYRLRMDRSRCAWRTTPKPSLRAASRGRARCCASAIATQPGASAGRSARPDLARCATDAGSSDGGWQRRRIPHTGCRHPLSHGCRRTAACSCNRDRRISAPARTRS